MAIGFRIIESAPLPVKETKERSTRQRYDFASIPVGGAGAFPIGDEGAKKARQRIYGAAYQFSKKHTGFTFKVGVEKNDQTGTEEVWVRRLAGEGDGGAPAAKAEGWGGLGEHAVSEAVTNGTYDYSVAAAE